MGIEQIDPKDCPYYLVSRASLTITAHLKQAFTAAGVAHVRPGYLGVLMCLWREDRQKGVNLGRCAGLEPSTMTGLLDRMERDGLLERRPDPGDRRAQRILLTRAGQDLRGPVTTVVEQTLDRLLHGVPDEELQRLKGTLRQVLANSDKLEP